MGSKLVVWICLIFVLMSTLDAFRFLENSMEMLPSSQLFKESTKKQNQATVMQDLDSIKSKRSNNEDSESLAKKNKNSEVDQDLEFGFGDGTINVTTTVCSPETSIGLSWCSFQVCFFFNVFFKILFSNGELVFLVIPYFFHLCFFFFFFAMIRIPSEFHSCSITHSKDFSQFSKIIRK